MRLLRLEKHTTTALLSKPHPDGSGSYVLDGVKVQAHSSKRDPELYFPTNDLIISHLECAAISGMVAEKHKKKAIHLLHNDQDYCVGSAEKYAHGLIYNTEWIMGAYKSVPLRIPKVLFHPPVDPKRYTVETTREYITLINLTIGTTNKLSYDKGGLTFYELARRFPHEKFLGVQGGYGDQYIPSDLPGNVTILPHTNNILDVYRQSKVVLVPSKYESYGRVAVESACSGIPSLLTDTAGTREAMGWAANFCERHDDFDEWEDKLNWLLATYDFSCESARERSHFNWARTLEEWKDVKRFLNEF